MGGECGWNGLCVKVSEGRAVSNGFMLKVCLSPRTSVASRPGLLPRAMSGSVVLLQPGFFLTSTTHVTTVAMLLPYLWSGLPPLRPC